MTRKIELINDLIKMEEADIELWKQAIEEAHQMGKDAMVDMYTRNIEADADKIGLLNLILDDVKRCDSKCYSNKSERIEICRGWIQAEYDNIHSLSESILCYQNDEKAINLFEQDICDTKCRISIIQDIINRLNFLDVILKKSGLYLHRVNLEKTKINFVELGTRIMVSDDEYLMGLEILESEKKDNE